MIRSLTELLLWTVIGGALLSGVIYVANITDIRTFSTYSYLAFLIISVLTLFVGFYTFKHPNELIFGNAILGMMILKLITTPFLVIWYIKTHDQITTMILIPFFFSYLWFTVYEMYYLLNKSKET